MKVPLDELVKKHCACKGADSKIILEAVTVCPECFSFFSQVIANIPVERVDEAFMRLMGVMKEMGLLADNEPVIIENYRDNEGAGTAK